MLPFSGTSTAALVVAEWSGAVRCGAVQSEKMRCGVEQCGVVWRGFGLVRGRRGEIVIITVAGTIGIQSQSRACCALCQQIHKTKVSQQQQLVIVTLLHPSSHTHTHTRALTQKPPPPPPPPILCMCANNTGSIPTWSCTLRSPMRCRGLCPSECVVARGEWVVS